MIQCPATKPKARMYERLYHRIKNTHIVTQSHHHHRVAFNSFRLEFSARYLDLVLPHKMYSVLFTDRHHFHCRFQTRKPLYNQNFTSQPATTPCYCNASLAEYRRLNKVQHGCWVPFKNGCRWTSPTLKSKKSSKTNSLDWKHTLSLFVYVRWWKLPDDESFSV